jgi:hypothetical protein
MDTCQFCKSAIRGEYFRVGSAMACSECVAKFTSIEATNKSRHFRRGLLFATIAALIGCLAMWGVDEFSSLTGSSSLFSFGAYLRGGATLFLGAFIGGAAQGGSRKRGSLALQICAVILTYLAYSIAFVPFGLSRIPSSMISAYLIVRLLFMAPAIPFLSIAKSYIAISGLVILSIAMYTAWSATGKVILVDGPYGDTETTLENHLL